MSQSTSIVNPNNSILDYFNKQTYLGNSFVLPINGTILTTTDETSIAYIINPASNAKAIYLANTKASSSDVVFFRTYINPTVSNIGIQTVALVADSSGSLNSTYFLLNSANDAHLYYVWFNINSAGVDPAIPGRTGVPIIGATNATAATLGAAVATAIGALSASSLFTTSGTSTVTITNKIAGPFNPIIDGVAAPTGFTFAMTAGLGVLTSTRNLRPANTTTSGTICYIDPAPSNNGTFYLSSGSQVLITVSSDTLIILDPGQSLLVTAQAVSQTVTAFFEQVWYEL